MLDVSMPPLIFYAGSLIGMTTDVMRVAIFYVIVATAFATGIVGTNHFKYERVLNACLAEGLAEGECTLPRFHE